LALHLDPPGPTVRDLGSTGPTGGEIPHDFQASKVKNRWKNMQKTRKNGKMPYP